MWTDTEELPMKIEFTKLDEGCMECGKDRQCSNFNHEMLTHWQMKICGECYKTYYDIYDEEGHFKGE
jgi:hypothetical protein